MLSEKESTCLDLSYCQNGGTCYYLISLGAKVCRCPDTYFGKKCEYTNLIVNDQPTLQELVLHDRTFTITGIAIATLVLASICITGYCIAKQKRDAYRSKKTSSSEKSASPQSNGYKPVDIVSYIEMNTNIPSSNTVSIKVNNPHAENEQHSIKDQLIPSSSEKNLQKNSPDIDTCSHSEEYATDERNSIAENSL